MRYSLIALVFSVFLSFNTASANNTLSFDPPVLMEILNKDFPLFKDSEDKIFYIDFELITTNIKSLKIVNEEGDIAFSDDVSEKSVNDIYELDYSDYTSGKYKLELDAYSGSTFTAEFIIK